MEAASEVIKGGTPCTFYKFLGQAFQGRLANKQTSAPQRREVRELQANHDTIVYEINRATGMRAKEGKKERIFFFPLEKANE